MNKVLKYGLLLAEQSKSFVFRTAEAELPPNGGWWALGDLITGGMVSATVAATASATAFNLSVATSSMIANFPLTSLLSVVYKK